MPDSASSGERRSRKPRTVAPRPGAHGHLPQRRDGRHPGGHANPRSYNIPIIYLTAYADSNTLQRAKVTEPFGYVLKPFEERELLTTIEMALYKYRIEQRLKDSEARFRSLFENSQDIIYISDRNGDLLEMNPAGLSLFGYAREEMLGAQSSRLYADPHDHKLFFSRIKREKSLKDVELKLRNKRGEMIYGLETANTMVDKDGKMSGVQGIIRDITAKKKQEETLALLQTAIDASSEAVLITDRSGTIVFGNPAVEALTGYDALEIIGRSIEYLGYGVARDEKDQQVWKTVWPGARGRANSSTGARTARPITNASSFPRCATTKG